MKWIKGTLNQCSFVQHTYFYLNSLLQICGQSGETIFIPPSSSSKFKEFIWNSYSITSLMKSKVKDLLRSCPTHPLELQILMISIFAGESGSIASKFEKAVGKLISVISSMKFLVTVIVEDSVVVLGNSRVTAKSLKIHPESMRNSLVNLNIEVRTWYTYIHVFLSTR